jgi:CzcA family heavy metal efflux pump
MLRWIVGGSLKFRLLVVLLAAGVMIGGIAHLRTAPVDALPEYTLPYVEIQTESLGLSAAEVEQFITVPLEQDLLNGVKGVETIRSNSITGLSSITLVFERGTDILRARQLVQERLSQPHAFPNVSKPPQMLQPVSSTSRVMMIALSSKRLSPIQLSVLARWTVRPRLMGIAGVANVAIWGHRDRQLQVQVDPQRLRAHDVSLLQVIRTTGNAQLVSPLSFLNASTPGTGGFVDGPNQRLGVRHILPFGAPHALGQVPIEHTGLRLGDVANVVEDHQPLIGDAIVNGGGGLMLVVEKLPGANTLEITRKLDEALRELRPGMTGVTVDTSAFRPATFIESAMSHLALAALIAAGLVLLALTAFFLRWRAVLISAVAIPLSLVTAAFVMELTGGTINALVLAGLLIALGIVVDDAIGDVQHVGRRLQEHRDGPGNGTTVSIVRDAALEMRSATGYATLVVLLAMVPVFFTGGLTGAFVHPMALSYALAVLASMVVALTVTPALCLLAFSRAPRQRGESPILRWLASGYDRVLQRFIRRPRPALLTIAAVVLVGLAVLPLLGQSLRPSFKDRDLLVHWNATPSTSLPEMSRITRRATAELRSIPGVRDVGAHVGRAVTSDQTVGTGSGELWLSIDPGADYDATLRSIRQVVTGYPGMRGRVLTYEDERSRGVLTRADDGLVVRLYGQELRVLRREAQNLQRVLAGIDGVRDPRVQLPVMQPTLQIQVDLAAAQRHRINPGDVRRAAATLVAGLEVGSFFEHQKVFSVVVWGVPATRHSVTSVRNLLIDTPGGGHVRLGDVARVQIRPNPVDIRHDAVSRYMDVRAAVQGRDAGAVRADVRRHLEDVALPLEYHAELIDTSTDERPTNGFVTFAIAAAAGIFLLLQAAFGSWRLAALLFVTLPIALVDGVLVAFISGTKLSLGELVGLFTIFAIAARNGIVLIRHFQHLAEHERQAFGPALVLRGARERLGPIVMTAVTTAVAVLPFAVLGDVAGNEITHAMAVVILGGLVTSTLLSLFILPALYLHYGTPGAIPVAAPVPAPAAAQAATAPNVDVHA